jgi:hypothetical protein
MKGCQMRVIFTWRGAAGSGSLPHLNSLTLPNGRQFLLDWATARRGSSYASTLT